MKTHKKIIIIISILIFLLLAILIYSSIFALLDSGNRTILTGISIANIDVSGLSVDEAKEKINKEVDEFLNSSITIKYDDYETTISQSEIDCKYNVSDVVDEAYKIGKSGNIFQNNFAILNSKNNTINFDLDLSYDNEKLDNIIDDLSAKIPGLVTEPSYYISDDSLIILKGSDGIELLKDETKNAIVYAIENHQTEVTPSVKNVQAQSVDIESIYNEIHTEPQNASVQKNPFKLTPDVKGTDFAITLDEAKNILSQDLEEYVIPLVYTEPEITVNDLGDDIFPHTLSYATTRYDESNPERVTNLKLSAEKINGIILLPGETFSFNQTVGKRTIEAGYKEAVIYSGGKAEMGLGGGVCQISSTLYNAVLMANLDIVERKNHSLTVSYADIGKDATVSYGSIDLKFTNSRSYPIRIDSTVRNGTVTISIQGIREETEYTVELEVETTQTIPFETTYINDTSLSDGERVIVQSGKNGYKCSTYKILKLNGITVSRTLLSTDTYKSQDCIIHIKK